MKIIKIIINKMLPEKSICRLFFSWIIKNHLYGLMAVVRSLYCTRKLTGKTFPIQCLVYPRMQLNLKVDKKSDIQLKGRLHVELYLSGAGSSYIEVNKNSQFIVKGDFHIGQNVQMMISSNASLTFCGGDEKSSSGITSDTKILVAEKVVIGKCTIISWNCFITDSDWHEIGGSIKTIPVYIGDHVWVSHGVSILRGAGVNNNSIIGAKSTVSRIHTQKNALLCGSPATVIKKNIIWGR